MPLFPYNELEYYSFGLRVGVSNLLTNGLSLGLRKTVGKITQPINAFSRFPEYYYFDSAIRAHLQSVTEDRPVRILDLGSPKTLGLYLATRYKAEVTMTDISELNIDEYRMMWNGLKRRAQGKAVFELQDARGLDYGDDEFDVVYSMSVVEHVDGASGDSKAILEMIRVLKPGGLLAVSVPFGGRYTVQQRVGFAGAVRQTGDSQEYFFQRIYDQPVLERRVLGFAAAELEDISLTTVWRRNQWAVRGFGALGTNLQGLLGFLNPLLSLIVNQSTPGIDASIPVRYGARHTARDIYGDLILKGQKTKVHRLQPFHRHRER
jgi:SAM-dependent methyltransferase